MARFVSLFAGVGGFDLGLEASGHTCIGQVEIDKNARKILERHWPNVPKHDDVTTAIDWGKEIGLVVSTDLVVGGFPCQDLSVAGKRVGLAGERSGLFHDALAFAKSVEAKTIILENVPGLLSSNQGRDFGTVLTELANAGYSNIEWRVLNSQFFGVAQRRRRVFIVANLGTEPFKQILFESESGTGDYPQGKSQGQDFAGAVADGTGAGRRVGNFKLYDFPNESVAPTMTALRTRDAIVYPEQVARMRGFGDYEMDTKASALKARDYKDVTDIVVRQEP
jgi:DNA (cytosine-5)-methyltransferase 1